MPAAIGIASAGPVPAANGSASAGAPKADAKPEPLMDRPLKVVSLEHEIAWAPHFLQSMDYTYTQRARRSQWHRFADGAPGTVGVIASVTEPFCDACDRMRITADGQFRSCLFALDETNLRDPLREGAPDEEMERLIRAAMWEKWSGHRINHPDFVQPRRSMSAIGG